MTNCPNCLFSEAVVTKGSTYTVRTPHGDLSSREHEQTIYICREGPPLGDTWPQVLETDWCGRFTKNET